MASETISLSHFHSPGGVLQLKLESPSDLPLILELDAKQWVAIGCPIQGHEFDDRSLELIDGDQDGRIRIEDVKAAVKWHVSIFRDETFYRSKAPTLSSDQICDQTPEGQSVKASLHRVLEELENPESQSIDLEAVNKQRLALNQSPFNGDGLISRKATSNPDLQQLIDDILKVQNSISDNPKKLGITETEIEAFYVSAANYQNWFHNGKSDAVLVLGENTPQLYQQFIAVSSKIDEWFALSQRHSFAGNLQIDLPKFGSERDMKDWPIAPISKEHSLNLRLQETINPAWKNEIEAFCQTVLPHFQSNETQVLSLSEWDRIKSQFGKFAEWKTSEPTGNVGILGIARLDEILQENEKPALAELIATDKEHCGKLMDLLLAEKAIRFQRDLFEFVNNFVSFNRFYTLGDRAIFQTGRLYLDSRSFDLCLPVNDPKKHAILAQKAGIFLIYCELKRKESKETRYVAVAVTNGDAQRVILGKQGVFYDRENAEWDATIVQVLSHPINLRQAIVEPFHRLGDLFTNQIEKIAASREKDLQTQVSSNIQNVDKSLAQTPSTQPAPPQSGGSTGGLLAGGGFAFAAIASSLTFLSSTLSRINPAYFVYSILVLALFILFPVTLLAVLKLRKRDLGMLLEANGWAINGHLKLTFPLANSLTHTPNIKRGLSKFGTQTTPVHRWLIFLLLLTALFYFFNYLR